MPDLLMLWLGISSMTLVIFWGSNLKMPRRFPVTSWLVVILLLANVLVQYKAGPALVENFGDPQNATTTGVADDNVQTVWEQWGLRAGELRAEAGGSPVNILLSTLVNVGWLPLLSNLWIIVLLGSALETAVGSVRMTAILLLGLLVPGLLEGLLPLNLNLGKSPVAGGASGIVYAVGGAALCCIPGVAYGAAINVERRFWIWTLIPLGLLSVVTWQLGAALTEVLLICGIPALIYLLQPKVREIWMPLWGVLAYKLAADVAIFWPYAGDVLANSLWRIGGGLAAGAVAGAGMVLLHRQGNASQTFGWAPEAGGGRFRRKGKTAAAPADPKNDEARAAAMAFLAQRVFLGDAEAVADFYPKEVMTRYRDMVLPEGDQWHLARILANKGRTAEALHAYTNLVEAYQIEPDQWDVWLTMAELALKTDPDGDKRTAGWLEKFLEGESILLRDRLQAQRLLGEIRVGEPATDAEIHLEPEPPSVAAPVVPPIVPPPLDPVRLEPDPIPVELPRLTPGTFNEAGQMQNAVSPTAAPVTGIKLPEDNIARQHWKLHAVRETLDPELLLQAPRSAVASEAPPSGFYGTDDKGSGGARPRGGGRMANVEIARRHTPFRETPRRHDETRVELEAPEGRSTRLYGAASDAPAGLERPVIRLKKESDRQAEKGD